jgi:hypothetical protein
VNTSVTNHRTSVDRLIDALVCTSPVPRTVGQLADAMGLSERTLRYRCKVAGTTPKACLDFARCLQLITSDHVDWHPGALLSEHYADCRTVKRLITEGGLTGDARPTLSEFLDRQQLLASSPLRATLKHRLGAWQGDAWRSPAASTLWRPPVSVLPAGA